MHTPGPWKTIGKQGYTVWANDSILFSSNLPRSSPEGRANARLAAAAPALLDELKECHNLLKAYEGISRNNFESLMLERIEAIEAAIAKAT